jgi:RNA recognition motif-containing protein
VASAKIITDRQTGQPRGFGFVEMETKLEGQKAISMINGRSVDGRPLAVNEAKPQVKGSFGGGGRGGYR